VAQPLGVGTGQPALQLDSDRVADIHLGDGSRSSRSQLPDDVLQHVRDVVGAPRHVGVVFVGAWLAALVGLLVGAAGFGPAGWPSPS
jgi:hypothetical protein